MNNLILYFWGLTIAISLVVLNQTKKKKNIGGFDYTSLSSGTCWLTGDVIDNMFKIYKNTFPEHVYLGSTTVRTFTKRKDFNLREEQKERLLWNENKKFIFAPFNTSAPSNPEPNNKEQQPTGTHWVLIVANIEDSTIVCYDSFGYPNMDLVVMTKEFIENIYKETFNKKIKLKIKTFDKIVQSDGVNCGVFVIIHAWLLTESCVETKKQIKLVKDFWETKKKRNFFTKVRQLILKSLNNEKIIEKKWKQLLLK
jgi:hypothetical protein